MGTMTPEGQRKLDRCKRNYEKHDIVLVCNNATGNRINIVVVPIGYELVSTVPVVITRDNLVCCLVGGDPKSEQEQGPSMFNPCDNKFIGKKRFMVRKK